jgi:hypothetical protein
MLVNVVIFHVDLVDRTNVRDMANFQGSYTSSLMKMIKSLQSL